MKNRRKFITSGLASMVTGVIAYSGLAHAKESSAAKEATKLPLFLGLIYSKDSQGKWKGKDRSHAPIVKIKDKKITITTDHGMSKKHYIVRHTLVTETGDVVGEKTFSFEDKEATSTFDLPEGQNKLYATSFCNKHDLWLTVVDTKK